MSGLWQCEEPAEWLKNLEAASERIEDVGKDSLIELDSWFVDALPVNIRGRDQPSLTSDELVKLVDWKLTRGKWRPQLQKYARSHNDAIIKDTTLRAFHLISTDPAEVPPIPKVKEAIEVLAKLKGIGPATATAILTAANPSIPFLSDEAMAAALTGKKDYTVPRCLELTTLLRKRAEKLSESGRAWTAQEVERAIFSDALSAKAGAKGGKATGKGSKPAATAPAAKRKAAADAPKPASRARKS